MTTGVTLSADSPELLAALGELDGVAGAAPAAVADVVRVELGEDRDHGSATAVAAAIEAMLQERFGVGSAGTSVVEEIAGIEGEGRLALDRLVLTVGEGSTRADVIVRLDDRSAPGTASGPGTDDGGSAIATALLLALEELTEDAVIGSIERAGIDGDGVARVRLRLDVDGSDLPTSGEAAVVRHRPQAVVRAVLAAVEPHLP